MNRTTLTTLATLAIAATALLTRRPSLAQEQGAAKPGGVKSITLPQVEPNLPDAPGRDAVTTACVLCHSTRYITMQPNFTREAWTASVDKMRKVFGAPITDAQVPAIVDYLVAIRGPKQTTGAPAAKP